MLYTERQRSIPFKINSPDPLDPNDTNKRVKYNKDQLLYDERFKTCSDSQLKEILYSWIDNEDARFFSADTGNNLQNLDQKLLKLKEIWYEQNQDPNYLITNLMKKIGY